MPVSPHYRPDPRWSRLDGGFYDVVEPARFPKHVLRFRNDRWAKQIGLETLTTEEWENHFARFEPVPENLERPLALRYHGHQFGVYNPYIGDGRAFLYAQVRDSEDDRLLDLGTKGSGRTPWSRDGDGRLTLKGGVREVLTSEMLEALGVYTSKALSLFETGESLYRGDEPSPTRSSVLVRLSHSLVRIGTFQRLAFHRDASRTRQLLEFAIENYMPYLADERFDPAAAFFREVSEKSANLVASWMVAGFVHGVINSDNMTISGESFDYGPYRFLPTYDPDFVAAYFDASGLYAFGRQPEAVRWNLAYLADALMPVASSSDLLPTWQAFTATYRTALSVKLVERLGVRPRGSESDCELTRLAFDCLRETAVGFQRFFFDWYGGPGSHERAMRGPAAGLYSGEAFRAFRHFLERYEPLDARALAHPYFARGEPCDLLIDEIEAIWKPIAEGDDWSAFERKIAEIRLMGEALADGPGRDPLIP